MTAEPGPLGEEAARLVDAVRDWAARTFPDADRRESAGATVAAECRYCPICQAVAVLRGERPEVTNRVADAVVAAASALSAIAEALARPHGPDGDRPGAPPRRWDSPGGAAAPGSPDEAVTPAGTADRTAPAEEVVPSGRRRGAAGIAPGRDTPDRRVQSIPVDPVPDPRA